MQNKQNVSRLINTRRNPVLFHSIQIHHVVVRVSSISTPTRSKQHMLAPLFLLLIDSSKHSHIKFSPAKKNTNKCLAKSGAGAAAASPRPRLRIDTPLLHYSWPQSRARDGNSNHWKFLYCSPAIECIIEICHMSIFPMGIDDEFNAWIYTSHWHTHTLKKLTEKNKPSSIADVWEYSAASFRPEEVECNPRTLWGSVHAQSATRYAPLGCTDGAPPPFRILCCVRWGVKCDQILRVGIIIR